MDKFLRSRLKGVPAGLVFRLLRQGRLRVNGRKAQQDYRLQAGDVIDVPELRIDHAAAPRRAVPSSLIDQLRGAVLYEDQSLLVIDKPAGVAVHKGTDVPAGVIEALRQLRPELPELELCHHLDRDTSGVLAVAKSPSMLRYLHGLLRDEEHEIERHYLALVAG
ncbi:MAG TPA: pseudouridine synthase, partial [Brevibacterium sp.]|nr:pseudouridine synthase [Brevibacterium sp.]